MKPVLCALVACIFGMILSSCCKIRETFDEYVILPESVQHGHLTNDLWAARNEDQGPILAVFADRVKTGTPVSTKFKFAPAPCKPPKVYAIQRYDTVPAAFRV